MPEGSLDASIDAPEDLDAHPEPNPELVMVAAGGEHSCALYDDGNLHCWGNSWQGQLGYGRATDVGDDEHPKKVGPVSVGGDVTQIAAGSYHSCALLDGGSMRCWGSNSSGQLGYGHTNNIGDDLGELPSEQPAVNVGGTVVQLATGYNFNCALLDGGSARCWGGNHLGQLGYGNTNTIGDDELPSDQEVVSVGSKAISLATGFFHTCALLESGSVRCWGSNTSGQLGYGHTNTIGDDELPSSQDPVNLGGEAIQIAAGGNNTCAILANRTLRCWGDNAFGQLGLGHTLDVGDNELPSNTAVSLSDEVKFVTVGYGHICALLTNGTSYCWGDNHTGELGYGHDNTIGDDPDNLPSDHNPISVGGDIISIAAGGRHTCAALSGGALRCWGDNSSGKLGYGHTKTIGDNEVPSSVEPVQLR